MINLIPQDYPNRRGKNDQFNCSRLPRVSTFFPNRLFESITTPLKKNNWNINQILEKKILG